MKKTLLLLSLIISGYFISAQETIFEFTINSKTKLQKISSIISIDNVEGNTVTAYANLQEFEKFKALGIKYKVLPHPGSGKALTMATTVAQMADWDRYPTHDVLMEMIDQFAVDYPEICRVETIGMSEEGRPVKVVKITDNPDTNENEPEFFYTGQMHGDEIVAYIMFLRLADYLLENYDKNQRVTDLINNVEIWINPLSNPDGTYNGGNNTVASATRSNSNGVDLNRSFPTPNLTNPAGQNEAEVQMMIAFAENNNLVLSANSHSGIELVNFPWDTWESSHPHADHDWWYQVSRNYADIVHENAPANYMDAYDNGVTHGGDWYVVNGSRQDHMGYYQHCREVTLELSDAKMLDCGLLPAHWDYNKDAMIGYIEETFYGIRGIITDENENPLDAIISISGHDADNSEVLSDSETGNYHRMIDNGTYNLTFTVSGYTPITINNISITDNETTIVDVMFNGSPSTTTLTGTIINHDTNNPIENAEVIITGENDTYTVNTDASGSYSVSNITVGTYKFEMSAPEYMSAVHYETVSTADHDVSKHLIPELFLTGTVTDAVAGTAIEGAEVEVLNSSIATVLTNVDGEYYIPGIIAGTYDVKASKTGYSAIIQTVSVSSSNTVVDFSLPISTAISFESEVPEIFLFSGDQPWTREMGSAYDGDYSMKSGNISHDQTSVIETELNILSAGEISFYKKVSSESGYDFLKFYIDDSKQDEWSGSIAWGEESYSVSTGIHTFKWEYSKDGSLSSGDDCAWIDLVDFPPHEIPTYSLTFTVTDGFDPIQNASINLEGQAVQSTDAEGQAIYTDLAEGVYNYIVTSDGFVDFTSQVSVYADTQEEVIMEDTNSIAILEAADILIYPNPTDNTFGIKYSQLAKVQRIDITNIFGSILKTQTDNYKQIVVNELSAGIYYVIIHTKNAQITKKLVIK